MALGGSQGKAASGKQGWAWLGWWCHVVLQQEQQHMDAASPMCNESAGSQLLYLCKFPTCNQ